MNFKPIQKLDVRRTLSTGDSVAVGVLAQNRQGVFFQYAADYLERYANLSPFTLKPSTELQLGPDTPHQGIHGVFADCLPDGWGLLLQDRVFRQQGILAAHVTAMDRLAFVGHNGMGALSFEPVADWLPDSSETIDLANLGLEAQALFEGETEQVLAELVAVSSSGGARPKAQLFMSPDQPLHCRTRAQPGDDAWLVKFTSQNLPLGHEEGLCEAAYLQLAQRAKLEPPEWQLLQVATRSGPRSWLAVKRFDWLGGAGDKAGRYHLHSACGLLDADFRSPSLDYADLIKASRQLCKSPAVGQRQFRRALFNLFACNQDDHSKNWAFLQDDSGAWRLAPFYDVTFSPHPYAEHATAFAGFGKNPPLKAMQTLARHAGFANWKLAQQALAEVVEVVANFAELARELELKTETITLITRQLNAVWQANKGLLGS
ncbi:type II toxin-antitoxin system HipA family toxin [Methylomonas albis]|uniref:Type II toxin-antitoxin system HipA family toxin n=1 Tax=Methylomonas albis TaxID=1854563 RepID=A0ABR9CVG9_9GAMM|nr:type II toxin-antitoxin system HipA family toxin [Methylomonas albis]MBD9354843.1 type II toxin-antitoxin system HipA family toxin [Methylomonas albis]